jgi:hypothetical protein
MTDPRPRDEDLKKELDSLHEQEREGHETPKEERRAEFLERRLHVDEHGAEVLEEREEDRGDDKQEERRLHRRLTTDGRSLASGC